MLAARQFLVMRRTRDRAIGMGIAPVGTVVLLPDPDVRRRVLRRVSHGGLALVTRQGGRMDRAASVGCPMLQEGGRSGFEFASRKRPEHAAGRASVEADPTWRGRWGGA